MVMVDSQSRLGSLQAHALGASGEEEKRRQRLNWFPPTETTLKRTLIPNIISVLLGSRPTWVSPTAYNGGNGSL